MGPSTRNDASHFFENAAFIRITISFFNRTESIHRRSFSEMKSRQ
jgi:hypothetical protein